MRRLPVFLAIIVLIILAAILFAIPISADAPKSTEGAKPADGAKAADAPHPVNPPMTEGIVVNVKTGNTEKDKSYNQRLHFCLFENGGHDLLYVGTNYGMWSKGSFELIINEEKAYAGKVPHMVYGGTLIDMGDVLTEQPKSNLNQYITRVGGMFK